MRAWLERVAGRVILAWWRWQARWLIRRYGVRRDGEKG